MAHIDILIQHKLENKKFLYINDKFNSIFTI